MSNMSELEYEAHHTIREPGRVEVTAAVDPWYGEEFSLQKFHNRRQSSVWNLTREEAIALRDALIGALEEKPTSSPESERDECFLCENESTVDQNGWCAICSEHEAGAHDDNEFKMQNYCSLCSEVVESYGVAASQRPPLEETCGTCGSTSTMCGTCYGTWCEECDPCPAALCPWCHGRGYSTASIRRPRYRQANHVHPAAYASQEDEGCDCCAEGA